MGDLRTSFTKMAGGLHGVAPPPCDACWWTDRCAMDRLACRTFYGYVYGGRSRERPHEDIPSHGTYHRIYKEKEETA